MRIAAYHPWVYLRSGIERSFAELFARSRHEWVLYTHHHEPASTYPELADFEVVQLTPSVSVRRALGPLVHAAATIARTRLPADGARALLVSSEGLGDLVMARAALPAVCFCHTPLKILHDPETRARLAEHRPVAAAVSRVLGAPFAAADRAAWRRYRAVLVNSEETRKRVVQARLATAERIEVLHPGVDLDRFGGEPTATRSRFLLVAGRIMWQKNVELALDAFRLARAQGFDGELVVAGMVDVKSRPYLAVLRSRVADLPVRFELDPDDARLAELYRTCLCLVYPPPNEDWGMVPLEAMAAGAPVIAVDAGGPRESVVHGVTGWLLPPTPEAFARQILAVDRAGPADLRRLGQAAQERVRRYSWDAFARRLDDVVEQAALSRPTGPTA